MTRDQLVAEIEELEQRLEDADQADRPRLEEEIGVLRARSEALAGQLENAKD